jgi:hypothetical protein
MAGEPRRFNPSIEVDRSGGVSISNASNQRPNVDVYSRYAPKRIREGGSQNKTDMGSRALSQTLGQAASASEQLVEGVEESFALNSARFLQRSALTRPGHPENASPFTGSGRARPTRRVMGVKAWLLFTAVGVFSAMWTNRAITGAESSSLFWSRHDVSMKSARADYPTARLVIADQTSRNMGEASPLGVSFIDLNDGGLIVVKGLANDVNLSAGDRADNGSWWLSARDLSNVMIQPPADFVGAMDIGVELRLADTSLSDYRTQHLEWVGASEPASEATIVPEAQVNPQSIDQIPSEQILASLKRGRDLIADGDFAAARLVLQHAAEGGSAQAALMLAGTYDPMTLKKLRAHGCVPDIPKARYWYERAGELGSPDAPEKLKVLANKHD